MTMPIKIKAICLIALLLAIGTVSRGSTASTSFSELNALIDEGLLNNPHIKAKHSQWKSAIFKAKYISKHPDPKARISYFGESVETRVGPQEQKYGISQTIPFPGKLSLKGSAQNAHANMLQEQYKASQQELVKNIKFVYFDIFWVDAAISITENEKSVLSNMEHVARKKYELNVTSYQDVIKAQVELSKLEDKLLRFKQNRASLVSMMNSLLNRPAGTAFDTISVFEPQPFTLTLENLKEIGTKTRQELLAAEYAVEKAKKERLLSKLNYLPDFTLSYDRFQIGDGETTQIEDGKDAWLGTLQINLPIWFGKLNSQVNEKEQNLNAKKEHYQNIQNRVTYEIEDAYYKIQSYKDIVTLYKKALVPQAEQAFEAARTGYESKKVDFLNWLDAERVYLHSSLAYYKSIVDYQKSIAHLERTIGKELKEEDQ